MKITQQTPDTFVINAPKLGGFFIWLFLTLGLLALIFSLPQSRTEPVPIWVYLFLGMWVLLFGLLTILSPNRSQIVLNKRDNQAELRRRFMLGYHSHWFKLSDIDCFYPSQKFDVQSVVPDASSAYLNISVTGGMDVGDYSVSTYLAPLEKVAPILEAANAWMKQTAP